MRTVVALATVMIVPSVLIGLADVYVWMGESTVFRLLTLPR